MAGNSQDFLLNLLMKVSGSESISQMSKALREASDGTLRLGKNQKVYQDGVRGAISATKALSIAGRNLTKTLNIQTGANRAVSAATKAKAKASREAASASATEASSEASSTSATNANTSATNTNTASKKKNAGAAKVTASRNNQVQRTTRGAEYAVLSMSQTIQDSAQFSMGMAQGFRAITNNVQVMSQALIFAAESAKKSGMSMSKAVWTAMKGPGGILLLVSTATMLLEVLSQKFGSTAKAVNAASAKLVENATIFDSWTRIGFKSADAAVLFAEGLKQIEKSDFTGFLKDTGRDIRGIMSMVAKTRPELNDFFLSLERGGIFAMTGLGPLIDRMTTAGGALSELAKDLQKQAEKAKALEDMWWLLEETFGLALLMEGRLKAETKELGKAIEEVNYQTLKRIALEGMLATHDRDRQRLGALIEIQRTLNVETKQVSTLYYLNKRSAEEREKYLLVKRREAAIGESLLWLKFRIVNQGQIEFEVQKEILDIRKEIFTESGKHLVQEEYRTDLLRQNTEALKGALALQLLLKDADGQAEFRLTGEIAASEEINSLQQELLELQGTLGFFSGDSRNPLINWLGTPEELAAQRVAIHELAKDIEWMSGVVLAELSIRLGDLREAAKEQFFTDLGTNIGNGVKLIDAASSALYSSLGTMAIEMGKAFIAFGVAGEAMRAFIANPILAVAAGTALVAIGTALKNKSASIVKKGTSSSSSSSSSSSYAGAAPNLISNYSNMSQVPRRTDLPLFGPLFGPSAQNAPVSVDISLVAEGDQLIGVINDTYQQRVRTVGTGALVMGRGSQKRVVGIKNRFGDDGFNAGWRNP